MRCARRTGHDHRSPRRLPSGFLLLELSVAAVLVGALMLVVVHSLNLRAAQRRFAEQQQIAWQEAANLMERIAERGARGDVVADDYRLSPAALAALPDARLKVESQDDGGNLARLAIAIDWQLRSGARSRGVRLTSWVYRADSSSKEAGR